jgi:predicted PolB exonuclease-like 3'-5' exonuclease
MKNLFVFDIETIPDIDSVFNLTGNESLDVNLLRQSLKDYHLDVTQGKNDFLRQPFHKVVAISFAIFEIDYVDNLEFYSLKDIRSGGDINSKEKDLILGFFKIIKKLKARLVSFNGRTFDIPVLKYRAMKYGISSEYFYKTGDKWNNYNNRYSLDYNCDLLDAFSDFGSSARIKMHEVCSIFDFPGKFGVDGSKVDELYDLGKLKEIRDYCETDVLNTSLLYLRYALHIGKININGYNEAIKSIITFIDNNEILHLKEFKKAWEISCKGDFYLS